MTAYKVSDEEFIKIVNASVNIRDALQQMNLALEGGSYSSFMRRCERLNVKINYNKHNEIPDCNIIAECKNNISVKAVLTALNLNNSNGSNVRWIKTKIKTLNIDTSHFLGMGYLKGKSHAWNKKMEFEEIFIQNSKFSNRKTIKKILLSKNLLEYKCYHCDIKEWNSKEISLQLEHINGVNNDNRVENLTLLCPNCHSQTSTFAEKNKGSKKNQK